MGKVKTFSFESFKEAILEDSNGELLNLDTFDPDNGIAIIHESNLNKYLEEFMCKDQTDLQNYLYYHKGIFLRVI